MDNVWLTLLYLSPLLIVMIIFDVRARNYGRKVLGLPRRYYVSLLWIAILDPVFEVVFIGVVLWEDLTEDPWHWAAGAVGVFLSYFFARYRMKVMWVRPLPEKKAAILRNSNAEILALFVLIAIKMASENTNLHAYWFSLLITCGMLFVVSESTIRVILLFRRYNREVAELKAAGKVSEPTADERDARAQMALKRATRL